eukprot:Em0003g755a
MLSAAAQDEDDEEDIDDEEEEDEELDSEEDGVDEEGKEYLKALAKKASNALGASESSDEGSESSEGDGLTLLEIDYETVVDDEDLVDEFFTFKNTLELLSASGDPWYSLLTSGLSSEHLENIKTLFVTAEQRKAARDSRKIEEQGGYQFVVTQVGVTALNKVYAREAVRLGKDNDSVKACTPRFCKTDMTSSSSSIGSTAAAEGADKPVHLALLPPGSPTGEFWRDKTVIEL